MTTEISPSDMGEFYTACTAYADSHYNRSVRILLVHSDSRPFEVERFGRAWVEAGGATEELVPIAPSARLQPPPGLDGDRLTGVLLTGGPDVEPARYGEEPLEGAVLKSDRDRDELDLWLLRLAEEKAWPVLAVCYGCQILTVAAGGTLIQNLALAGLSGHSVEEPKDFLAHEVEVAPDSRLLAWAPQRFPVNSRHHQAVRDTGPRLRVVARAADGVIEAVEGHDPDRFVLGVQWHPENLSGGPHRELFAAFRAVALRRASR
jgi:putative glutamine amidotransferase